MEKTILEYLKTIKYPITQNIKIFVLNALQAHYYKEEIDLNMNVDRENSNLESVIEDDVKPDYTPPAEGDPNYYDPHVSYAWLLGYEEYLDSINENLRYRPKTEQLQRNRKQKDFKAQIFEPDEITLFRSEEHTSELQSLTR